MAQLDESARRRLGQSLDREGVVAALLFGSQATGRAHPHSDVDVAVWLDPALDADARLDAQLRLSAALGRDDVDLVISRNLLVHGYAELDDRQVWRSLEQLDDLRAFAAAAATAARA